MRDDLSTPELRRIVREVLALRPPADWRATVLELWRGAEYREERYAALALLRRHAAEADLALVEEIAGISSSARRSASCA
jgi:hypothetical protein